MQFFKKRDDKKLRLALEYGVILSETAKERGVELTTEIVQRMEDIVVKEFAIKNASKVACEMQVNILAAFETQ